MKEVLYHIKSLDKLILRNFIKNSNIADCRMKKPTHTQMDILEYILKNQNRDIKQNELEEVLNLRRATVSGVLHTMESNGLITRVVDEHDTRTKKIILNNKTKNIFLENKKKFDKINEILISGISGEDLDTFIRVINKMKENMQKEEERKREECLNY